jgi:hypothetical protein
VRKLVNSPHRTYATFELFYPLMMRVEPDSPTYIPPIMTILVYRIVQEVKLAHLFETPESLKVPDTVT